MVELGTGSEGRAWGLEAEHDWTGPEVRGSACHQAWGRVSDGAWGHGKAEGLMAGQSTAPEGKAGHRPESLMAGQVHKAWGQSMAQGLEPGWGMAQGLKTGRQHIQFQGRVYNVSGLRVGQDTGSECGAGHRAERRAGKGTWLKDRGRALGRVQWSPYGITVHSKEGHRNDILYITVHRKYIARGMFPSLLWRKWGELRGCIQRLSFLPFLATMGTYLRWDISC